MHRRKITYLLVVILVVALSGTGIYIRFVSQRGAGSGNGGPTAGATATRHPGVSNQHFVIGTDLPVSGAGAEATAALAAQYGVDLAITRNADLGNGNTLTVIHMDDMGTNGADPATGAKNVQTLIANPQVMAIVGPFDSNVAAVEIPLVETDGIVEVSPNETNPGLTQRQYASLYAVDFTRLHPAGAQEYYFRIPGNDVVEGRVDAQLALQQLHAKTAFVVDDDTAYGKGLAEYFTQAFTAAGGKIGGAHASIPSSQAADPGALAASIKSANPDIVYYGGDAPVGAALKLALAQQGFQHPLVGGNGITADPRFTQGAGTAAANSYGTAVALDVAALTSTPGQGFLNAFETVYPAEPLLPYSAMAYDAAMVEIDAIKSLIAGGMPVTRASVRDAVAAIHYDGASGQIGFDANGDNLHPVFSVYATDGSGVWSYERLVQG